MQVILGLFAAGAVVAPLFAGSLPPAPAGVQVSHEYGIEFVRVQAQNVKPFQASGSLGNVNRPVGGGSWDFGLARTELTQGQWIQMPNAFDDVAVPADQPWSYTLESMLRGDGWVGFGMYSDGFGSQGRLAFQVTELGAALPVDGIGWIGSVMYSNWLHNDRAPTIDSLLNGAYDLRQWNHLDPQTWLTVTRSADARFWVPTYDEWAVGSFYDPNRFGPGEEGWWPYLNRLTRLPIPGPPGMGETSAGWNTEPSPGDSLYIPVGSYPDLQSPWGLLDTSGSRYEGIEDAYEFDRAFAGTRNGLTSFPEDEALLERLGWVGQGNMVRGAPIGLRIATSNVPGPIGLSLVVLGAACFIKTRTRQ